MGVSIKRAPTFKPNLPPGWMHKHFGFLLTKNNEDREAFFLRVAEIFPPTDERYQLIEWAYETAKREFAHMPPRTTGERYFEHLRATALILIVHLRVRDANIIAAALLHDIVEDIRERWSVERLRKESNDKVAGIVNWVSKPEPRDGESKEQLERRYHRRLAEAPREAILVKLADRLHNLITLWGQKPERIRNKVLETHNFIIGLAEKHQILVHEIEAVLDHIERRYKI